MVRNRVDKAEVGAWNARCDRCGWKYKNYELHKTWDNLYVCRECWEPRHPQDFVRGVKDDPSVPWSRLDDSPDDGVNFVGDADITLDSDSDTLQKYTTDLTADRTVTLLTQVDDTVTTASDASSNGNDGTLVNGPTWTSDGPNNAIRGALSFDGVDDAVELGDIDTLDFTGIDDFALEAWVKWDGGNSGENSYIIHCENFEVLLFKNTSDNFQFAFNDGSGFGGNGVNADATPYIDEWVHVAGVANLSNDEILLYLNGTLVDTQSTTGSVRDTSGNSGIGNSGAGSGLWSGEITDTRSWKNTARTQQQIQDNMNTRLTGDESGLVGYWKLDDGYTAEGTFRPRNKGTRFQVFRRDDGNFDLDVGGLQTIPSGRKGEVTVEWTGNQWQLVNYKVHRI